MFRSLIFLLVLGNVVIFALSAFWGDRREDKDPQSLEASHQPLSPDRIRIVSRGDPPPIVEIPKLCLEWPTVSASEVADLEKAAGTKGVDVLREETQSAVLKHLVFIPVASGGKAGAEKKAAELKKLGVKKFDLVQEAKLDRWNVELGVYESEADAAALLEDLKKVGVRSAKVGVQTVTPATYRLRLSGTQSAVLQAKAIGPSAVECATDVNSGAAVVPARSDSAANANVKVPSSANSTTDKLP